MLVIMDESGFICLPPSQDHKRVGEGDTGPNTGGMGAYAPAPVITESVRQRAIRKLLIQCITICVIKRFHIVVFFTSG